MFYAKKCIGTANLLFIKEMREIMKTKLCTMALVPFLFGALACNNNESGAAQGPLANPPPFIDTSGARVRASLTSIAAFDGIQVTGVTASQDGRLFASFPRWRQGVPFSVVEIKSDGSYSPYPDRSWNIWSGQPRSNSFTCVQSVIAHGGSLYVLDPSNPEMQGVIGKPTLYEFDLKTNTLKNQWSFDETVAPAASYLNDFRIDDKRHLVYITESGTGSLIVLDLQTGNARRVLDQDTSTKTEPINLVVNGNLLKKPDGSPQRLHVDGIALNGDDLYYHAVTAYQLYRIPTSALANTRLPAAALATQVEKVGMTPMPDGMIFDKKGNLYMADLQNNAVVYRTPNGEIHTLIKDMQLHWADTFALSADGQSLLLTDSHLDEAAPGQSATGITFNIYQIGLP
jgi:hypothetical protein